MSAGDQGADRAKEVDHKEKTLEVETKETWLDD